MFEESLPAESELQACARALDGLSAIAAVDVLAPDDDPSGHATLEVVVDPGAIGRRGRVPVAVINTVYDPDAPWSAGIARVDRRAVDIQRVLIR